MNKYIDLDDSRELKAKPNESLYEHSFRTYCVCKIVLKHINLYNIGFSKNEIKLIEEILPKICFVHDLGKANDAFQNLMIYLSFKQPYRHEYISAWILHHFKDFSSWLFKSEEEIKLSTAVIINHHVKFKKIDDFNNRINDHDCTTTHNGKYAYKLYFGHKGFIECINAIKNEFKLSEFPKSFESGSNQFLKSCKYQIDNKFFISLQKYINENEFDSLEDISFTMHNKMRVVLKVLLMCCDGIASAMPQNNITNIEWVKEVLSRVYTKDDFNDVINNALLTKEGNKLIPREFQLKVQKSKTRATLVVAGCGGGKTTAAYLWSERATGKKLFYLYPTTNTSLEGFKDYIADTDFIKKCSKLITSRAEFDMKEVKQKYEDVDADESITKIESFNNYDPKIIVATVDQVLGLIQNYRSQLYGFLPMLNGAFIFDEPHMYDDKLWNALKYFIKFFPNTDFLFMTATLQESRIKELKEIFQDDLTIIYGDEKLEEIKRYSISTKKFKFNSSTDNEILDLIKTKYNEGKKITIVSNVVDRCRIRGNIIEDILKIPVVFYHSRFEYHDVIRLHEILMKSFREEKGFIVSATQKCEVSLDVSSDLLITDETTIAAYIQRFGRLERFLKINKIFNDSNVIVLDTIKDNPYTTEDMNNGRAFFNDIKGKNLSQKDLKEISNNINVSSITPEFKSELIDKSYFCADIESIRKAAYTITVIREVHKHECLNSKGYPIKENVIKYSLPMNYNDSVKNVLSRFKLEKIGFIDVIPDSLITYDSKRGAKWNI